MSVCVAWDKFVLHNFLNAGPHLHESLFSLKFAPIWLLKSVFWLKFVLTGPQHLLFEQNLIKLALRIPFLIKNFIQLALIWVSDFRKRKVYAVLKYFYHKCWANTHFLPVKALDISNCIKYYFWEMRLKKLFMLTF